MQNDIEMYKNACGEIIVSLNYEFVKYLKSENGWKGNALIVFLTQPLYLPFQTSSSIRGLNKSNVSLIRSFTTLACLACQQSLILSFTLWHSHLLQQRLQLMGKFIETPLSMSSWHILYLPFNYLMPTNSFFFFNNRVFCMIFLSVCTHIWMVPIFQPSLSTSSLPLQIVL